MCVTDESILTADEVDANISAACHLFGLFNHNCDELCCAREQ